jgi:polysaccharide pyruvyl transferase WcaK-like protein
MKKIGLIGFFGWGNFGDELFVKTYEEYLGKNFIVEVVHDITKRPYFSKPVKGIVEKYDAFIIGGGDLVIPWQLSELYWKIEYLNKPVYLIGLGVPTWGKHNPAVIEKMKSFFQHKNIKKIIMRDIESAKWVQKNLRPKVLVEHSADLVCAISLPKAIKTNEKILGIVTRQRKHGEDDYTQLRRLCDEAVSNGYKIRHLILAIGQTGFVDKEAADLFSYECKETIYTQSLDEQMQAISECTIIASMKFHGSVIATMYGVPSIVLSPTDKSTNFMRRIGREDLVSDLNDEDLHKHFSSFTAFHSNIVIEYLRNSARKSLNVLKNQLIMDISSKIVKNIKEKPKLIENAKVRDVRKWNKKVFWHKTLENFKTLSLVKSGIHSFSCDGLFYDFLIENNHSNTTVFYFSSNEKEKEKVVSFLVNNENFKNKNVNKVYISVSSLLNNNIKIQYKIIESIEIISNLLTSKVKYFSLVTEDSFTDFSVEMIEEELSKVITNKGCLND